MKNIFFVLLILLANISNAQTGKVFDNLSFASKLLKNDRKYAVYLPPDYHTSERSYPVLYLLHGSGDDQTGWVQFGEVLHIADKAILEGNATPMVIVMPDANTGKRGYYNHPNGQWRYEDFFFDELIPFIERTYRVKTEKRFRAIAGLSMGGGGTFVYALHHPEMFAAACPLSAATGPMDLETIRDYFSRRTIDYTNEKDASEFYKKYSVLQLINGVPADQLKAVRWYIDCGDDDFLFEGNSLVHIALKKREIPHEFRIRDGAHTWTYWRESLPTVLSFVSESFHQH